MSCGSGLALPERKGVILQKTLVGFVWKHSKRDQLLIVIASFVSFPLILAMLFLPKEIVNKALKGTEFPQEILGLSLDQIPFLITLCALFLLLIFLNNGVKYYINISKGLTGERILRRIRYQIYERVTRLPLTRLRSVSPGEVVQVISAEVEPIGGFAGEVIATPVYQGGQLIVYLGFIIAQDPFLGFAAVILFPVQAFIIPKIQKRIIKLVQTRIRNVREMTAEIQDAIQGIEEMRIAGAHSWHLARISERLYTNFRIRYRIFFLKYAVKFANNVVNNITPFFFYSFGGYLVIKGRMDLGALVAILAAYKDIAAPWRELLTFYQTFSDISTRYEAVVESYGKEPLAAPPAPVSLAGQTIALDRISSQDRPEAGGFEGVSLTLTPGRNLVLAGEEEGGRTILLKTLAGLHLPVSGTVRVGEAEGPDLLQRAARHVAFVGRNPHILTGTVRENVAYDLLAEKGRGEPPDDWPRRQREAAITGATPESPFMDWVDYARIGLDGPEAFDARAIALLLELGLERELFARGLSILLDPAETPDLAEAALSARQLVRAEAGTLGLSSLVEPWDPGRYLENATLAENLFFAVPDKPLTASALAALRPLRKALSAAGLEAEVATIGLETAEALQELLGSLGGDPAILDRIGLIRQSEREEYARIVAAARKRGVMRLPASDRDELVELALQLVPLRHRLGVLDDPARRERLIAARQALAGTGLAGFTRLGSDGYVPGLTLIENILDGRPRLDRRDANPPVETRLSRLLAERGLRDFVLRAGLRTEVGLSGNGLSPAQRRRLALARALISEPDLLVLESVIDDATPEDIALREIVRGRMRRGILVHGTSGSAVAEGADDIVRIAGGRLGTVDALTPTAVPADPAASGQPLQREATP